MEKNISQDEDKILQAIKKGKSVKEIKQLIGDVNRIQCGTPYLYYAVENKDKELVELLIKKKASLGCAVFEGSTINYALGLAIKKDLEDIIIILLQQSQKEKRLSSEDNDNIEKLLNNFDSKKYYVCTEKNNLLKTVAYNYSRNHWSDKEYDKYYEPLIKFLIKQIKKSEYETLDLAWVKEDEYLESHVKKFLKQQRIAYKIRKSTCGGLQCSIF